MNTMTDGPGKDRWEGALEDLPVVEDMKLAPGMSVNDIVHAIGSSGGFSARSVATAADILEGMFQGRTGKGAGEESGNESEDGIDADSCYNFLSFPSNLMATGCRGVLVELVKRGWIDAVITTGGTLSMDIIRSSRQFYQGSFRMDDEELHENDIYRLGNVVFAADSYGAVVEARVQPMLEELFGSDGQDGPVDTGRKDFSSRELAYEVGARLGDDSLLHWCHRKDVPVFVPGITDGAFGSQLWQFRESHPDFRLDLLRDEHELADIVFTHERTGALMIGGGISKHHVIWWNQFKDGLDRAVYITSATELDGSLSGAPMREAISWGKVNSRARYVTVNGDATLILPILVAAMLDRLG